MAELILDSLQIENYRLLERLSIPRLGRVNLITGKNNVGKTSLLEALRIYAERAAPRSLIEILIGREEMSEFFRAAETNVSAVHEAIGNLFPGRPAPSEPRPSLGIGPIGAEPRILRVNPGWYETGAGQQRTLETETELGPEIRSMGDGVNRALGLSLALVNARDGFLLLDEFDNGLHYTVQLDLWRHVFRLARELNVQVFATTHSYDCVQAFQEAAVEAPDDGLLIRLSRQRSGIVETSFDEEELEIATRRRIEVR